MTFAATPPALQETGTWADFAVALEWMAKATVVTLHNGTVVYAVADAALVSATQHGVFINETADSVDNLSIV